VLGYEFEIEFYTSEDSLGRRRASKPTLPPNFNCDVETILKRRR
jgi:hypothetical protein